MTRTAALILILLFWWVPLLIWMSPNPPSFRLLYVTRLNGRSGVLSFSVLPSLPTATQMLLVNGYTLNVPVPLPHFSRSYQWVRMRENELKFEAILSLPSVIGLLARVKLLSGIFSEIPCSSSLLDLRQTIWAWLCLSLPPDKTEQWEHPRSSLWLHMGWCTLLAKLHLPSSSLTSCYYYNSF